MFGFDKMFGSLTLSPIQSAVNEARRMARSRMQSGGSVAVTGKDDEGAEGFVLPSDIHTDLLPVAITIGSKLRALGGFPTDCKKEALNAIEPGADGRVVIPAALVKRLGNGEYKRGRADLERLVSNVRIERLLREISEQSKQSTVHNSTGSLLAAL
jgi:hypothetical protein